MPSRMLSFAVIILTLALASCGGGNHFVPPPVPGPGPFSNASLSGNYAFMMTGNDNGGFFMRAGSLVADGKGNFTGIEDVNSGLTLVTATPFTGTYSIGADGRGTLTGNASGTTTYLITVISATQVAIVQVDSFATASGVITAQNTAAFNAGLSGNYTFDFSGIDVSGFPLSIIGAFSANAGLLQTAESDTNDGGTVTSGGVSTGTFSSVDATTGRGTASLQTTLGGNGNLTFAYYIVSPTQVFFINTNSGAAAAVSGTVSKQQPPAGGFASSTFSGNYTLAISGASNSRAIGNAALFHTDGVSSISAGILDENNGGSVTPNGGLAFTGTFTAIDANGRGTITLNTTPVATFVFYLISPQSAVIQETDSSITSDGTMQAQSAGPFSNSSLKTHFSLNMTGSSVSTGGRFDLIGNLAFDGAGNITGGESVNNQSNINIPLNATLTGTYSLAANGRGTLTLQINGGPTLHFALYATDASTLSLQGTDAGNNSVVVIATSSNQNF